MQAQLYRHIHKYYNNNNSMLLVVQCDCDSAIKTGENEKREKKE